MLCILTASLSWSTHALAQQAQQAPATTSSSTDQSQPQTLEEVTVTGSRIKHTTDYTAPTPTTVLDATTMQNLGIVNIGQALEMTPSNVSEFTPATTGNSAFYTGSYIADLRGLNGYFSGGRTLTMIDGNRVVPTNTQDTFDLNFIPQILVQRMDTVTGGASAAYGSGAESGVVNVILNHDLEGGQVNADEYDTHYNDAKDKHVAAAYGHGLFDNRVHFVVAGEYESSDPASCQFSGRTWCSSDTGAYTNNKQIGTTLLFGIIPEPAYESVIGSGLTNNTSRTGVLSPNTYFNTSTYSLSDLGQPTLQASPDGLGLTSFQTNNPVVSNPGGVPYYSAVGGSLPGGSGEPVNEYTNLQAADTRALFTAMLSAKITDNINADLDLNWGKVDAYDPGSELYGGTLANNNPYLPANIETVLPSGYSAAPGIIPAINQGYSVSSDLTPQVANDQINDTTLKRAAFTLKGTIGASSWSWDGYAEYGETNQEQGTPNTFTNAEAGMALDAVSTPNGPECRVTATGSLANAYASATNTLTGGYGIGTLYPGSGALPGYLTSYAGVAGAPAGTLPINPLTGLNELQTLNLLSANCQPLNILGTSSLANGGSLGYSTGALGLTMQLTQKQIALNASGDLWKGIGAGAFSLAVGYDWRSVDLQNNFNGCPEGTANTTPEEQACLVRATDFSVSFGDPYGGTVAANEVYMEVNAPLLKDLPFAHALEFDLAGRESFYSNTATDAVSIDSGTTSSYKLPTWKASMLYEPVDGLRFRASQSHDARAPDTRDLYYSQQLPFTCGNGNPAVTGIPATNCIYNMIGNADLKPETTNTTTLGLVFSPPQLAGLQASTDWFHIHLTNGIDGGTGGINPTGNCYDNGPGAAAYCNDLVFTQYSYNAAGQACGSGVAGAVQPNGVNCAGAAVTSGLAAYRTGNVANILQVNLPAFNGAFYDERGVDFSVSYTAALPGGSTLSARALATWVGKQNYENYPGSQNLSLLGQTGSNTSAFGIGDYQTAARWQGNMSITWALGGFSLTPNMRFVGVGTLNNYGIVYNPNDPSTLATWYLEGFPDAALAGKPGAPADAAAQAAALADALTLLPANVANRVPAYFVFGLNGTYNFTNIPGIKNLALFVTVNNLFNKSPPYTGGYSSNPVFFDTLGLAYRAGFRLTF